MTFLRKDPNAIGNEFDRLLEGVGHRGSSFTDIDALTHDARGDRFLFQEFKQKDETVSYGQWRALDALSRLPNTTVWIVRKTPEDDLLCLTVCPGAYEDEGRWLHVVEYREMFADWWRG